MIARIVLTLYNDILVKSLKDLSKKLYCIQIRYVNIEFL